MTRQNPCSGVYLTRLPLRTADPKMRNQFGTEVPLVEFIPFNQIAWASPYSTKHKQGIIVLLNTLEFRCYIQTLDFLNLKVCEFVGRQAKAGLESPQFPWVLSPPKGI
jgi:hypothetical protein